MEGGGKMVFTRQDHVVQASVSLMLCYFYRLIELMKFTEEVDDSISNTQGRFTGRGEMGRICGQRWAFH